MSLLINPEANFSTWKNVGKTLPVPEDGATCRFYPLQLTYPEQLGGPKGDEFVASANAEEAPTVELIRSVVTQVDEQSARIQGLDDVQGQDVAEGKFVTSPEGSKETYQWAPDFVNWSADRGEFSLKDGSGSIFEYAKLDNDLEVFATQSGTAPATFVLFDREEVSYTVVNQAELTASEEAEKTPYLIGG